MSVGGQRAAQIAGAAFLAAVVVWLLDAQFHFLPAFAGRRPLAHRELAMQFLGQYLARTYPGKQAIVLSNPFSNMSGQPAQVYSYEKAGIQGLKRGLGSTLQLQAVVYPDLKPEAVSNPRGVFIDPSTTTPVSYLLAEGAFDKVAAAHPGAEIIVSLIGVPVNIAGSALWRLDNRSKFALLLPDLRLVGNPAAIREAFRTRKIAGIVANKPGGPPEDQPLGADLQTEFDQRFLLVTPENIDEVLRLFPRLL